MKKIHSLHMIKIKEGTVPIWLKRQLGISIFFTRFYSSNWCVKWLSFLLPWRIHFIKKKKMKKVLSMICHDPSWLKLPTVVLYTYLYRWFKKKLLIFSKLSCTINFIFLLNPSISFSFLLVLIAFILILFFHLSHFFF